MTISVLEKALFISTSCAFLLLAFSSYKIGHFTDKNIFNGGFKEILDSHDQKKIKWLYALLISAISSLLLLGLLFTVASYNYSNTNTNVYLESIDQPETSSNNALVRDASPYRAQRSTA